MDVRRRRRLIAIAVLIGCSASAVGAWRQLPGRGGREALGAFLVKPYVQLGDAPRPTPAESLEVLWQAADRDADWSVESRGRAEAAWVRAGPPAWRRASAAGIGPRRLYRATVSGLAPGEEFSYRVRRGATTEFEARARARTPAGRPHRFVAFGDGGADSAEQRAIAYQSARARPDFVLIAGDLAYYKGLLSDYRDKFFPIYNSDDASPSSGAPLMRSTPLLVAPGNHDLLERDLDAHRDALAYFLVWSLPRNGPAAAPGSPNTPTLRGAEARRREFLDLAGPAYPRMQHYAFDFGDAHWTVLDTNPYVDWSDPALRAWLARDLASARGAAWRFVAFHQPPFHSTKAHSDEQRTRLLAEIFEEYHVDLVFNGHVHNYQRTYPLRFAASKGAEGRATLAGGHVEGRWTLDTAFDGRTRTHPDGVIYLITGGGGARLYDSNRHDTSYRQPFTAKLVSDAHSLTVVDVDAARLLVRQVSSEGEELDRFVVTRAGE